MSQTGIPFVFMRGGTSRGPYFNRAHLPDDQDTLAQVLIAALGAGHPWNINGIGGGTAVTTKVAMLSRSDDDWADVDYFFAQVAVDKKEVDFKPSCGNILAGVGPAAIELGLVKPNPSSTTINIHAVNTGARISATVATPNGVTYSGDTRIDGVPGTGSAIELQFMDTVGGVTGKFLPTGNLQDHFDGVPVTCMDVAMPMVIAQAKHLGVTGYETCDELDNNRAFMDRIESIRLQAGHAMGLGDVRQSVAPKFGILAPAKENGTVCTRYFMPWSCHPSMAVTGAQCIASCLLTPGSIAEDLCSQGLDNPATIVLEHASGNINVVFHYKLHGQQFTPVSAGLVRTARKLADGQVYIPAEVWAGLP